MKKKNLTRITCVGDSITFGQGVMLHRGTQAYPAVLEKELGKGYKVSNFGVMNRTATDVGAHPYTKTKQYTKSLLSEPDIVTIMLGTNDGWQNWVPELFEVQLANLVRTYQALPTHPKVILMTPCYGYQIIPKGLYGPVAGITKNEVVPLVRQVAEETGAVLLDVWQETDGRKDWLGFDGVHPNKEGNAVLGKLLAKTVRS